MRLLIPCILLASLTGCQYDRSFLQMSSDSGSPFLGLQLRVDASDSSATQALDEEPVQLAVTADRQPDSQGPFYLAGTAGHDSAQLITTAMAADFTSSVHYSLPESVELDETDETDESSAAAEMLRRMSAF